MAEGYAQFFGGAVTCGTCRFFLAERWECRRYPPQIGGVYSTRDVSHARDDNFPIVSPDWWCGEYRAPAKALSGKG